MTVKRVHFSALHSPRFQRDIEKIWRLGPRVVGELLTEIAGDSPHLSDALARYARLDPAVVRALGADRFPPRPLHVVTGVRHD